MLRTSARAQQAIIFEYSKTKIMTFIDTFGYCLFVDFTFDTKVNKMHI